MLTGRDKFLKIKPIINCLVKISGVLPKKLRISLFYRLRMKKGKIGILLRYVLLKNIALSCGDNVSIHQNVYILNPQNLKIGNNVSIHPMCYIESLGGVSIGNDVSIAHGTSILSVNHTWSEEIPIKYNKIDYDNVIVKDDVWIGCGSRIMAGTTIESRSIIAAGAVVTKNVDMNYIYGGVPAKKIKQI